MAEPVAGREATSPSQRVHGAANILVLEPSLGGSMDGVCTDLLAGADPASATVLGVTYRQSPAEWISMWETRAGTPARGAVVSVGDRTAPERLAPETATCWTTETIENATNLTALGVTLSDWLATHDTEPRLCFDSLTMLLQYADLKRAFRFLHVITRRVKAADGVGHYHLTPEAHDEQTLATIKGLFDAVIEVGESGEWTVDRR